MDAAVVATYGLDLVLADAPVGPSVKVKAYNHLLGECAVSVFGAERLASAHRKGFPRSLDRAPFLLPREDSELRRALDRWFEEAGVRPRVIAEFEDNALLEAFGQAAAGLFVAPAAIEREVCRQLGVERVGRLEAVRERFYAITVDRKIRHPAVAAISQSARRELFSRRTRRGDG